MSVAGKAQSAFQAPGQKIFRNRPRVCFGLYGFTLIELLVVIAIVALLAAILFPVFVSVQESGKKAKCNTQLKQLAAAMISYAYDNSGRFVPAASDIYTSGGGHNRWHGYRENIGDSFDPTKGPLWKYLGRTNGIKECPSAPRFLANSEEGLSLDAFESGCGGFGYNAMYVGGTYYRNSGVRKYQEASLISEICQPSRTILLADTAMVTNPSGRMYIEYSFVEPPHPVTVSGVNSNMWMSPSIHFRHRNSANVAWCDGHVTSEKMSFSRQNIYMVDGKSVSLGWFGPQDNSLFDIN